MPASRRPTTLLTLCAVALSLTFAGPAASQVARDAAPISRDELGVFEAVLNAWLGAKPGKQLINQRLGPAPSPSDPENADCVKGVRFGPEAGAGRLEGSLIGVQFSRKGLELVDGQKWSPNDRALQEAVRRGPKSGLNQALDQAFSHSLITFSRVAFSHDRKDALVSFGQVCGSLCGTGSTLRLHKTGEHWKISERCGNWIS